MGVRYVDITVQRETLDEDIRRVVSELRPDWPVDRIRTRELHGGCINAMYRVWAEPAEPTEQTKSADSAEQAVPGAPAKEQRPPEALIVRVFGFKMPARPEAKPAAAPADQQPADQTDLTAKDKPVTPAPAAAAPDQPQLPTEPLNFEQMFFNRVHEVEVMTLAAEHGLCSRVHGRFANGQCYDFADGRTLDGKLMASPEFIEQMTVKLARFHALPVVPPPDAPFATQHDKVLATMRPLLMMAMPAMQAMLRSSPLPEYQQYPPLEWVFGEMLALEQRLTSELGMGEIGFCHNDLNPKNAIWCDLREQLWLIDFETCMNNYVCYDLAMHFVYFCGHFLDEFRTELLPEAGFRLAWLRRYLREWNRLKDRRPSAEQFELDLWQLHRRTTVNMVILLLQFSTMGPLFEFKPDMFNMPEMDRLLRERPNTMAALGLSLVDAFKRLKPEALAMLEQPTPPAKPETKPETKTA